MMRWSVCLLKSLTMLLCSCSAFCSLVSAQEFMPLLGSQELIPVTLNEVPEKGKKPSSFYLLADTLCKVNENGKESVCFWLCETNSSLKNVKSDYRLVKLTENAEQICYLRSYSSKILPYGKCIGAGTSIYRQRTLKDVAGLKAISNKYLPLSKTGNTSYSLSTPEEQWTAVTDHRANVWCFENVDRLDRSDYSSDNTLWFSLKDGTKTYIQGNEMIYTAVVKLIKPGRNYEYAKNVIDKDYTTISLFKITKNLATGYSSVELINSFGTSGELVEMPEKLDNYVLDTVVNNKFRVNI